MGAALTNLLNALADMLGGVGGGLSLNIVALNAGVPDPANTTAVSGALGLVLLPVMDTVGAVVSSIGELLAAIASIF